MPSRLRLYASVLAALLCLFLSAPARSQQATDTASSPAPGIGTAPAAGTAAPGAPAAAAVPRSFRGVELGMDRDTVIAALEKDPIFNYRGPEDVSLLPSPNQSLIDVSGLSFVERGFFQFYEGKLWVMILVLDSDKVDHYSIYTTLTAKYGEPGLLDPQEARWQDATTRMALERPLTLRYMDMTVFTRLNTGSATQASVKELDRQDFLKGL
ncbi:MAG: hypothetical protein ACLQMF_10065 [Rectinemataceae bacterium]